MSLVGLVYVGFYVSDLITKLIYNKLPRRIIENTNDKAVLVTGMFLLVKNKLIFALLFFN